MTIEQTRNQSEIERLLKDGPVDPAEWSNEVNRLYLVIKLLFDKTFLTS